MGREERYKLGMLGYLVGLVRSSFPISIVFGILRSTFCLLPAYLIFKIVYDMGIFVGIISYMFTKKVQNDIYNFNFCFSASSN